MDWIEDLKKTLKCDVLTDEETITEYSTDASIFKVVPKVVVFPKNANDLKDLVNFVNKNKGLSLAGRSAGTDMTGGPLTESIAVGFTKHFNKIHHLDEEHAVVEPGIYYRDLEKEMDKIGVFYPSYPASKSICALGGMIANNSGSEKTLTYGQTVDHVRSLKVVLSDGNTYELKKLNKKELDKKMKQSDFEGKLYRDIFKICDDNYDLIKSKAPKTHKNSCGYFLWRVWDRDKQEFDLSKLFVGSQGTLGLWYEGDVNVVKAKKHSRMVAVYLKKLKQMTELVNLTLPYKPETLEAFDNNTMWLGIRFMPGIAKKVGKNVLSLWWGFRREALLTLRHGFPVFIILVEITGDDEKEVVERANKIGSDLKKKKIPNLVMKTEDDAEKYWMMRRQSFALLRDKVKNKKTVPFVDDFDVNPDQLPEFLPKLYKLLKDNGIKPTLAGHAGDGNFHVIPLMDLKKKSERDKIPVVLGKFVDLVLEYNGTITAEHNDGLIRTPFVEKQYGPEMMRLFEQVKDIFDPNGIFNPGKKVRGDMDYAMSHINAER